MAVTATVPILPCAAVNPNLQGHITPKLSGRPRAQRVAGPLERLVGPHVQVELLASA